MQPKALTPLRVARLAELKAALEKAQEANREAIKALRAFGPIFASNGTDPEFWGSRLQDSVTCVQDVLKEVRKIK